MGQLTGKLVRELFFIQYKLDAKICICRGGKKRKVIDTGYANRISQVKHDHPEQYSSVKWGNPFNYTTDKNP